MKSFSKKLRISIIAIVSFIILLAVIFFSYWAFAVSRINSFAVFEPQKMQIEGSFIELREADIYYTEDKAKIDYNGAPQTPAQNIILVHGLGGGAFTYRHNTDALADAGFNVYAIDLKVFGYSERALKSDYSHIEQAEILLEFMEKKDIEKAIVAGHSMGGKIALIAYDKKPGKFEKIILIDSAGLEGTEGRQNNGPAYSGALPQAVVDILYYNLFLNSDRFRNFLSSAFNDDGYFDEEVISYYLEPFKVKNTNLAYRYILKGNVPYDIKRVLKNIDIPVLIIWGDNDQWISVEHAHAFNNHIKGSQLEIIEDAGHVPMEEQAGAFNDIVTRFLK
jgi:pimeloyl-ACP methyl ester carboxylesterase